MGLKGKKIVVTVSNPLFHDRRMKRVCSTLSDQGAEVILVGVKRAGVPALLEQNYQQKLLKFIFQKGFLFYAELNIRLFFFLLFKRFDLVYSVDLDTLLPGCLIAFMKRKKRIYDAHEYFTEVPELEGRYFVKLIWTSIAKCCIGKNNITVSESLARVFENKYGKSFTVIRNLPELGKADLSVKSIPDNGPVNLLYIGYLNKGRGLENILEAMPLLDDRIHLYLVGSGDIETRLQERCDKLDLSGRVHFEGWKHKSEIETYLEKAHIGLNLLEDSSLNYYHSLANKTFDYMQYGIPGIHMDFPEYRIINKNWDCFYLIEKLDPETLVSIIKSIIKDRNSFTRISLNNLKASSTFCWDNEIAKLSSFMDV